MGTEAGDIAIPAIAPPPNSMPGLPTSVSMAPQQSSAAVS